MLLALLAQEKEKASPLGFLFPVLLLVGVYFLMIRPQRTRMRALRDTQATISPGAEVMTTAGMYGSVIDLDDETVTLEIAPGVRARFARAAVAKVLSPVEPAGDDLGGTTTD